MTRGFTAIELAIVLSIVAILVPLIFTFERNMESAENRSLDAIDDAAAMRTVSEELEADLRVGAWQGEGDLILEASCGQIAYVLERGTLRRLAPESCGGTRALAVHISAIERGPNELRVRFAHALPGRAPEATLFRVGLSR